jgi:M6 family metalloprotease-like protein
MIRLTDANGHTTQLLLDEKALKANGSVLNIDRTRVNVQGSQVGVAATQDAFQVTSIRVVDEVAPLGSPDAEATAKALSGPQPWVNILCRYNGNASEPRDIAYFNGLFGNSYPGLDHYWREVSYDAVNIAGTQTMGWYGLPRTRNQYLSDPRGLLDALFDDCTAVADGDVDFRDFVGINLIFNDELDGFAWGGSQWATLDGQSGFWYTTWEPPWGYTNQTVLAHEMGHGFGLPHSADDYNMSSNPPDPYMNVWDVMSDSWFNCFGVYDDPDYGCPGQATIAYHRDLLGWIPSSQRFVATPGTHHVTLEQLSLPTSSNYTIAIIPIDDEDTHFYTVEVRRLVSYDEKLPANAVIIHEVDELRWDDVYGWLPPAYVVDPDEDGDTADSSAQWTVGETFEDATNEISVTVISHSGSSYEVGIEVGGALPPAVGSVPADFDGDGATDVSVFRPANGRWYLYGDPAFNWGLSGDIPVPADFDADGDVDAAVFRPANGRWYVQGDPSRSYGLGGDVPVPCDYDGDGGAEIAVFRPTNGRWYVMDRPATMLGMEGDMPVPGDYDGDGVCEKAVFRPANGRWYIEGQSAFTWGLVGDLPVPGDYDGDGSWEAAVFRPSNGRWYIQGESSFVWGVGGDILVPGDYDGDGDYETAVFRPSNGRWYVRNGFTRSYGMDGDFPLPARDTNGDGDPYH